MEVPTTASWASSKIWSQTFPERKLYTMKRLITPKYLTLTIKPDQEQQSYTRKRTCRILKRLEQSEATVHSKTNKK